MKRGKLILCALLACGIVGTLAGCGGEAAAPETESNHDTASVVQAAATAEIPAMESAEVRLVRAKGNFLAVAFHGPYQDIGMSFCNKDGTPLDKQAFLGYGNPSDGWTLGITYELDESYTVDDIGLSVTDYDAPRNADGTYQVTIFPDIGEQMTDAELQGIGFTFLDGRCCIIGQGRATYGSDNFGLFFGITRFDEDLDQNLSEIEGFGDQLKFYAGDGTPLEDYFDGFGTLKVDVRDSSIYALLYSDGGTSKAETELMCDKLREAKPYMVFTGKDGTTQQFQLLQS